MKPDHFAEFRRLNTGNAGNAGNRGTNPEKSREITYSSVDGAVPHDLEAWGTGERRQVGKRSVPCVPHTRTERGTRLENELPERNQGFFQPVPQVPRVPPKDDDAPVA